MQGRPIRSPETADLFLSALASNGGIISKACEAASIGRTSAYAWREEDEAFREAWEKALEAGTDALEDEAVRRAAHGTDRPVFYKGSECGKIREYSDTLLMFMLKARRPEKFKDRAAIDHSGSIDLVERLNAGRDRVRNRNG